MGGAVALWQEFLLSVLVLAAAFYGLLFAHVIDGAEAVCETAIGLVLAYWFTKTSSGNATATITAALAQHTATLGNLVRQVSGTLPGASAAPSPGAPAAATVDPAPAPAAQADPASPAADPAAAQNAARRPPQAGGGSPGGAG